LPQFHNSVAILADYAHSLVQRGQFSQAAEKMLKAFDISPAMLKYLEEAIYFYGLAGHFHRVGDLLKTWDKLSPLLHHPFSKLACEMIDFMDKKNVEDVLLENLINVAISVLLQNQRPVLPYQFHISLKEDEESQWVHYGIPVCDISEAEIVKLDFELVDSLVEANLPVNLTGCFVTSYEALGVK
jgi:hypothetical protein